MPRLAMVPFRQNDETRNPNDESIPNAPMTNAGRSSALVLGRFFFDQSLGIGH
jgi:hypothetical protein